MNWNVVEDIIRIVCLCISLISALLVFIMTYKNNKTTLLKKLLEWFEKSFSDGKITADELAEGIKIIQELKDISTKKEEEK